MAEQAAGTRPVSALIIAHDARATGGVNNFLRVMRLRIRGRIAATRFANGPRHGKAGKLAKLRRMLHDYVRFCGLLLRRRFDVIHVNPTLDLTSMPRELVFVWLARLFARRSRLVIFYRGWHWTALDRIKASRVLRALFMATQRHADRILVLSAAFRDALVAMGVDGSRIAIVSTMFEGEVLGPTLERGIAREPGLILFLSRFMPAKNGAMLLRAFGLIAARYPHARLVMAGDGPDRDNLHAIAHELDLGERILFTGYIGPKQKMELLARATLFLLPTAHPEGMPNAILEAMAAGDVIVTTRVGGIPDIVTDGENGTLIDDPTPASLAATIATYLDDPARTAAIGAHNRAKAWSTWESAIVSGGIADHYEAIARPA